MTTRRGFLKAILAAGVAPYVVTTAGVLMPVRSIEVYPAFRGMAPLYGAGPGSDAMADIIALLTQTNEVLSDMVFVERNRLTTARTPLPAAFWRKL